jgi:hypothetical protein
MGERAIRMLAYIQVLKNDDLPVSALAILEVRAVVAAYRFVRPRIHSLLRRGGDPADRTTTFQSRPARAAPVAAAPQRWFDSNELRRPGGEHQALDRLAYLEPVREKLFGRKRHALKGVIAGIETGMLSPVSAL